VRTEQLLMYIHVHLSFSFGL